MVRHFKEIDKDDFKIIYNTYVRPHLEYCEQAWSPYLQKDKTCLLKVQRRATKMVKGLKKLPYETRLKRLGIYTLERRRLRGDLIETFKILTGKERIDYKKFFELADATSWLRGHSLKLYKPRCHTRLRQNFFTSGSSMNGTNSHSLSLKHYLSTPSKTGWTSTGQIWVTTADMATQPINLKYKYVPANVCL